MNPDTEDRKLTVQHWQEASQMLNVPNIWPLCQFIMEHRHLIQADATERGISQNHHPIVLCLVNQMYQIGHFGAHDSEAMSELMRMSGEAPTP